MMKAATTLLICLGVITVTPVNCPVAADLKFETDYRTTTFFRDKADNRLTFGSLESGVRVEGDFNGWRWGSRLLRVEPQGELAVSDVSGLSAVVRRGRPYWKSLAWVSTRGDRLQFFLSQSTRLDSPDDLTGEITVRPVPSFELGYEVARRSVLPSEAEFRYEGEGGDLDMSSPLLSTRVRITGGLSGRVALESTVRVGQFLPEPAEPGEYHVAGYQAALQGLLRSGVHRVTYWLNRRVAVTVGYRNVEVNAEMRGYDDGRKFAHFGEADLAADEWSLQAEGKWFSAAVHHGDASGRLAGVLEAWPFVDGLARFIGERRHLIAEADASWWRGDLTGRLVMRRWWELWGRADLVRLRPDARYVTWRPIMLGIGVDDLRVDRLELARVDLVRLQLSPRIRWQHAVFMVEVSQIIPLSLRYRSDNGKINDGGDEPSAAESEPPERHQQGFSLRCDVEIGF